MGLMTKVPFHVPTFPRPTSYLFLSPFLPFLQTMFMCTPWFHRGKDSVREYTNEKRNVLRTYLLNHVHLYITVSPRQRQRPGGEQRETQRAQTQQGVRRILHPFISTPRFHRGRVSVREYNSEKRNVHKPNNEYPLPAIPSVAMKLQTFDT